LNFARLGARFAPEARLHYIQTDMTSANLLQCDGCGQGASPEHIARRLKRLEWTTRFRPVHIQTLFLGAWSPQEDGDFLYSPESVFRGEAAALLEVAGIGLPGKTAEAVHVEFQRRGYFLTHVLECPLETGNNGGGARGELLGQRASAVATRIRRSLKPKRVVLIAAELEALAAQWRGGELGCPLLLENGGPYVLDGAGSGSAILVRLRAALEAPLLSP
jgi:hypothetical protein